MSPTATLSAIGPMSRGHAPGEREPSCAKPRSAPKHARHRSRCRPDDDFGPALPADVTHRRRAYTGPAISTGQPLCSVVSFHTNARVPNLNSCAVPGHDANGVVSVGQRARVPTGQLSPDNFGVRLANQRVQPSGAGESRAEFGRGSC